MSNEREIDGVLLELGEPLFFGERAAPRMPKKGLRALPLPAGKRRPKGVVVRGGADAVRHKLDGLVRRKPEVLVKISGSSTGMARLRPHLDYIARDGQIALEDQGGCQIEGRDALQDLRLEWQCGGFPIPESGELRQAFHLVLSMPQGTDPIGVKQAVRDFAADEFGGYQYVMALHTQATDPDTRPSPHPHVHLTIKARGLDGGRLNPRKADLQRWRELFATKLEARGIEAMASRRQQRFQRDPGDPQPVRQMKLRGATPARSVPVAPDPIRATQAIGTLRVAMERYQRIAKALAGSPRRSDQLLALQIGQRFGRARPAPVRQLGPEPAAPTKKPDSPER